VERGYLSVPYRDLAHPRITLAEQRAALRELAQAAQAKHLSLSEDNIFQTVASQRLLVEQARKKTARARRQTQTSSTIKSKSHTPQRTESGEPGAYDSFAGQVQPYPVEIWDE
jgi:hypothetical protein